MKQIIFGATALIALIGAANAADLPVAPPPQAPAFVPAPVYSWTGCFVGAGYGYGVSSQDVFPETDPAHVRTGVTTTVSGRGWYGQGQLGCDYQFPALSSNFVVGIFGDAGFGSIKANNIDPFSATVGVVAPEKIASLWAVGARIGWLATPKFLTYFSGGFTQAHSNGLSYVAPATGAPVALMSPSETYSGYFIGSGFEYGIDAIPGLFFKTEYRYSSYNAKDVQLLTTAGAPTGIAFNSKPNIQTVASELVYRFNWGR